MTKHSPTVIDVKNLDDAKKAIKDVGSDPDSIEIMAPKMVLRVVKLKNVVLQDAIIIKQDMLSLGGEVAVPKETFDLYEKSADILVIGNLKQLEELTDKLRRHYPRLKKIADELSTFLKDIK
ncbi:MAG: hypothetical protein V5A64_05010 [Candidatus Thermoplasmatota archaeon]